MIIYIFIKIIKIKIKNIYNNQIQIVHKEKEIIEEIKINYKIHNIN